MNYLFRHANNYSTYGNHVVYIRFSSMHSSALFPRKKIISCKLLSLVLFLKRELPLLGTPPNCQIRTCRFVRRLSEKQNISCKLRFVKSESQSTFQLFVLSLFSVLRLKNWTWNWNNQQKIAIQKKINQLERTWKIHTEKIR